MNRKIILSASVLLCGFALAGCGNSNSSSNSSSSSTASIAKSTNDTSSSTTETKQSTPWNSQKSGQLEQFMNDWAPTMGQSYTKYDGHNDLKTAAGSQYPTDFEKTTVNGSNASIGWSPDGNGNYDYNVVALYNWDRNEAPVAGHITYAFAFHNGQPVALVDQTTNGTPDWHVTQNKDVSNAFARIAAGKDSGFN